MTPTNDVERINRMKIITIVGVSFIGVVVVAWFGLPKVLDQVRHAGFETNIAGDYFQIATSDTYREIHNKKTGFSIPMRVVSIRSDKKFIVAIRKQLTNLESRIGPCEYYVIDHIYAVEHVLLTEQQVLDRLKFRPKLSRSFDREKSKRCNESS